jgi:transposase
MEITTVGLDIAKRVFQLHGVDAAGKAVLRRKLQRSEVLAFFRPYRLVWSALRLAARRIIGRVRSGS